MKSKTIANGMPFVNDEKAIGKWEYFAVINSKNKFDYKKSISYKDKGFKEIYFLPSGEKYWIFEGWTKNYLLIHYGGNEPILCYKYTIECIDTNSFLFIEITDNDSYICVLKKVSSKEYRFNEIGRRDNIDLPFITDGTVLGTWHSVAFVNNVMDFSPNNISDDLWLKSIGFNKDGSVIRIYDDETWTDNWTKGFLLDKTKSTASEYTVKTIDDTEYLFL